MFKTYNQRRILRVVARLGHGHLALVDAAWPRAGRVDPIAVGPAGDVEVVVIPRHLDKYIDVKNNFEAGNGFSIPNTRIMLNYIHS